MKSTTIRGVTYDFPLYLPDATRAVTKSLDSLDLVNNKIRGVVINTFHLMNNPGTAVIKKFGGVKKFMYFNGLVTSDSGGWQVFSLIHRGKNAGEITDEGVTFTIDAENNKIDSYGTDYTNDSRPNSSNTSKKGSSKNIGRKHYETFTPQKSIQVQFDLGSDIIICLDDFTPPGLDEAASRESVIRTTKWAKICKREYEKQIAKRGLDEHSRPHLYAVVQGGVYPKLRKESADQLCAIDFDGYGFGGYVIDEDGHLDLSISKFLSGVLPDDKVKFALGFGRPMDIINLFLMGWDIFDCTLPTRDARHRRLYTFSKDPKIFKNLINPATHSFVYIDRERYKDDQNPVSKFCDCQVCKNYSRAYLRHLFKIGDLSAYRLATIHNLRIYTIITEILRSHFDKRK